MRSIKSVVVLGASLLAAALTVSLAPAPPLVPAAAAAPPGGGSRPDCGSRISKPTGGWWGCTMVDHFTGSALNGRVWMGMDQVGSGGACVRNTPSTVAVADGVLRLSVVETDASTQCPVRADGTRGSHAAGWATTYDRFSQQYGRFEARIRTQSVSAPGLHEAFWLWPDIRYGADSPWPASGEIDIMETYSSHPHLAVPFLHYSADSQGAVDGLNTSWSCASSRGEWHTYALEWTSSKLTVLVDGRPCLVNTDGASSFRKRFIINLTQFLGGGTNAYDGRVPLPASMEVDWVKVWS
jgi:beta-glucanase (GH16 family)